MLEVSFRCLTFVWVKYRRSETGVELVRSTYERGEGGSKFCSEEGKSNAAKETKQRRDSHEKTNLFLAKLYFQGICFLFLGELTKDSSTPEALQKLMVMLSKPRTVR